MLLVSAVGAIAASLKWIGLGLWVLAGLVFSISWAFSYKLPESGRKRAIQFTWGWFKGALIWVFATLAIIVVGAVALTVLNLLYEIYLGLTK